MDSEWFWVTSLSPREASTKTIVRASHGRWGIENQGFNELGNQWHGGHGYKYNAHALLACTLLLFIARNLKPEVRAGRSQKYWAGLIAAEFITAFHPCAAHKPKNQANPASNSPNGGIAGRGPSRTYPNSSNW